MKTSFLLTYSNGWGHLIMSLAMLGVGLVLVLVAPDATTKAVGTGLIISTAAYWTATSSANSGVRAAAANSSAPGPAPAPPPGGNAA